ncbi:SRPBCC domain-containing protein [Paenibacillus chitinolyticus]|uniref:SRPBCC domain-containing protein n=1 Tax=Paenibacillus chitinolyticus TaxID=79263 RepID=UPI002DB6571F|nr:SRPBCC domain-containing protein [Paenibacillus chitinolyticus]MEC0244309.1 SRPBCC domain-containing protein [Paenibacillus chitinolyticus]
MTNSITSKVEDKTLTLERVFKAPRELVFEAFSQAEHLKRWWGPRGWSIPVCNVDFRVGGVWHYCMKCEDKNQGEFYGMESWGKAVYSEIQAPEKIVYTDYFSDAEGSIAETMPATICTLTFIEVEGGTKVVSRGEYATAEDLKQVLDMGMLQGITETWDRLGEHLASIQ